MINKIKNIIFDYGDVIFDIDFSKTRKAFENLGVKNIETFFGHRKQDVLFDEFDRGNISPEEWREQIRKKIGNNDITDQQIDLAWNTLLLGVPKGNHEVLLAVQKKYPTFLLSNNNAIHYKWIMNYLKEEYNLNDNSRFFVKDYYSHIMGMRKPDKEIFERVLDEQSLIPEETLFIDDSPQHLETANLLGFQTFLMKKPNNLQSYFNNNGLL